MFGIMKSVIRTATDAGLGTTSDRKRTLRDKRELETDDTRAEFDRYKRLRGYW